MHLISFLPSQDQLGYSFKKWGLILLSAIFCRGNPPVVALVGAGTGACPNSGRRSNQSQKMIFKSHKKNNQIEHPVKSPTNG
jgi:hypothetical protein